jgi:hypothetical protein
MKDASWQDNNNQYLSEALAWLRLRLIHRAEQCQPVTTALSPTSPALPEPRAKRRRLFGWFRRKEDAVAPTQRTLLPKATEPVTDGQIARAAAAMQEAVEKDDPPALVILGRRLKLSRFEQEILLLCTAMELDPGIATLCARAQGDPTRPYPTFALAFSLFEDPGWEALSPERPLRHWRLLEINQPGAQPLTTAALRVDERILNFLKGLNYLDDRLTPLLMLVTTDISELPPSQQEQVETIVNRLRSPSSSLPLIHLLGADSQSKQLIAASAARHLGRSLYKIPVDLLPGQWAELENLARLWRRESALLPIGLYIDAFEGEQGHTALSRFIAKSTGLTFLDTRETRSGLGRDVLVLDVAKPTPQEQQAAWSTVLGDEAGEIPGQLSNQFNLSVVEIDRIAHTTRAAHGGHAAKDQLWQACLTVSRPRLDTLAQRLEAKASWKQFVIPEPEKALLQQIAAQVSQRAKVYQEWGFAERMNRGLGISALFAGESGTGKTMAAEVIANQLHLSLYRIDLSQVVSKYIGETEKNLRRVFDAAEDGGAILFFDEADALFGKRSEVKDSHDRYANIEINYLLQRMEAYRGLAILATNIKSALDPAFQRRLRFIVNFPFPGIKERMLIWENVFPKADEERGLTGTPVEGLNYDQLARLNLTGGNIHNIALNAAFLAAREGRNVTMPFVLEAARGEFRKLDKPINEGEFRLIKAVEASA